MESLRRSSMPLAMLALFIAAGLFFPCNTAAGSFQGLGDLSVNYYRAEGISGDGTVVVGDYYLSRNIPFRWTQASGRVEIRPSIEDRGGTAYAVSNDGVKIFGHSYCCPVVPRKWIFTGGEPNCTFVDMPFDTPWDHGYIYDADASGIYAVGILYDEPQYQPFLWKSDDTASSSTILLPTLGGVLHIAYAISADGSIIAGYSEDSSRVEKAVRYFNNYPNNPTYEVLSLPSDLIGNSQAYGISGDGSTIVGSYYTENGYRAFRHHTYNDGTVIVDSLGTPPCTWDVDKGSACALDASNDGAVIVGYYCDQSYDHYAFVWDATNGMRDLYDVLGGAGNPDLSGWTLREAKAVSDDGKTFVGWGINPDGYEEAWIAKLIKTYTVTYDANGASSGTAPDDQTKTHDVPLTLATNSGNLARTGYTFAGWNTAADGSGMDYPEGGTYTGNAALTLYAKWTIATCTVTFDANGGTSPTPATKQVIYGETYGALATTARIGYTFYGWFTAATGGTQVTSGTMVTNASDHNLYAQWTANTYTVTFDANGGATPVPATRQVTFNEAYGDLANTSRQGYTFSGWFTAATGGTQVTSATTVTTAANHTLYAQWNPGTTCYVCSDGICGGNKTCHKTLREAVDDPATGTGTLIKIAAEDQDGNFNLDDDRDLTFQGGWDKNFENPNGGTTTLHGAPKAPQGSLTFQNLKIMP